jgi:hypothetical protein
MPRRTAGCEVQLCTRWRGGCTAGRCSTVLTIMQTSQCTATCSFAVNNSTQQGTRPIEAMVKNQQCVVAVCTGTHRHVHALGHALLELQDGPICGLWACDIRSLVGLEAVVIYDIVLWSVIVPEVCGDEVQGLPSAVFSRTSDHLHASVLPIGPNLPVPVSISDDAAAQLHASALS